MSSTESKPNYQDPQWLEQKYHGECLTLEEMASICGVSYVTIRRWMEKYGIERRMSGGSGPQEVATDTRYYDEEWLREKYHSDGLTQDEIGKICGVTFATIQRWMAKYEIETEYADSDERLDDEEWLREKYHSEGWTMAEIGDECGTQQTTVMERMEKLGIERRSISEIRTGITHSEETRRKMSEAHTTNESPVATTWRTTGRWRQTRKRIIQQDEEECALCGKSREENREETGRDLHVHHIIPVVEGGDKFVDENLITLCQGCHINEHN